MGAELLLRFHTSTKERPRYTIQTHGDCDMVLALLGPDDFTKQIRCENSSYSELAGYYGALTKENL